MQKLQNLKTRSEKKASKFNDIDLKEWKKYLEEVKLTTDALWVEEKKKSDGKFIIPKRSFLPKNSSDFHGLFIPEIPYQFILRFTKENETVWDCFGGSGTTHKVAKILKRECISNDLTPQESYIQKGDSTSFDPGKKSSVADNAPSLS